MTETTLTTLEHHITKARRHFRQWEDWHLPKGSVDPEAVRSLRGSLEAAWKAFKDYREPHDRQEGHRSRERLLRYYVRCVRDDVNAVFASGAVPGPAEPDQIRRHAKKALEVLEEETAPVVTDSRTERVLPAPEDGTDESASDQMDEDSVYY